MIIRLAKVGVKENSLNETNVLYKVHGSGLCIEIDSEKCILAITPTDDKCSDCMLSSFSIHQDMYCQHNLEQYHSAITL